MNGIPVLEYIIGFFAFGFIDLIMNDVVNVSRWSYYQVTDGTIVQSQLGTTDALSVWFWHGIVIAYVIIGMFWLWRKYTSQQYNFG